MLNGFRVIFNEAKVYNIYTDRGLKHRMTEYTCARYGHYFTISRYYIYQYCIILILEKSEL